jgi:hypothetical protein
MSKSDYIAISGSVLLGYSIYSLLGVAVLCGIVGIGMIGLAVYMARGEQ